MDGNVTVKNVLDISGHRIMEDEHMKRIGVTDTPCNNIKEDSLGVEKYIKGLENFVKSCPTPMSIALQGDWGTGKTSFLNAMMQDLENTDNTTIIYFNTWQYSQFKMSDNLYASFINSIVTYHSVYSMPEVFTLLLLKK